MTVGSNANASCPCTEAPVAIDTAAGFRCAACILRTICLPCELSVDDTRRLDAIISHPRPLQRASHLYRMGQELESLFVIRSGTVKTYRLAGDGTEEVTGFRLPGELVGFDALADGVHPTAAVTLERTTVCRIPFTRFEEIAGQIPGLIHQFTRLVGKHVVSDQELLLIRGRDIAEERVALFLLNFSSRLKRRGFSERDIVFSMPRRDIAKYLGLAVETVSRTLTRFKDAGLIEVDRRNVHLLDMAGLQRCANP